MKTSQTANRKADGAPVGVTPQLKAAMSRHRRRVNGDDGSWLKVSPYTRKFRREIHCDGLIEWGLLSCERSPKHGEEKTCPFPPHWPILQLANLIAWAHRVRIEAGAPTAEYALDIQIRVRGHATKVMNPVWNGRMPWLALLAEGSTDFPRYSLRDTDEAVRLIRLFKRDFWNSFGKDIGANEGEFEIENWPEHEPDQGS